MTEEIDLSGVQEIKVLYTAKQLYQRYNKLLEFVKKHAYPKYGVSGYFLPARHAREILEEIGELND